MKKVVASLVVGVALCLVSFEMAYGEGNDSYTKLLLHCDGPDGATNKTVTAVGTVQIDTAQKKFGTASGLFDGTGDYLSVPDSGDWAFGTGDFTIDARIRINSDPASYAALCGQWESNTKQWRILFTASQILFYTDISGTTIGIANNWTHNTNQWYHFAFVRTGNDFKMFVDGTQIGSTVTDTDIIPDFAGFLYLGTDFNDSNGSHFNFNGWIDEFRISKGIARWTGNFTPPTSAYISDPYTKLLLHCDGVDTSTTFNDSTGFTDSSSTVYPVTCSGESQIDTAQEKFGTASGLFDGTDTLTIPTSADWGFGSGNFTIDLWVRFHSVEGAAASSRFLSYWVEPDQRGFALFHYNGTLLYFTYSTDGSNATNTAQPWTPSINTWYHVAIVRNGAVLKHFVNGTQIGTDYPIATSSLYASSASLVVTATPGFDGWIDELRISKGIARWTANFTPPTSEYTPPNAPPASFSLTAPSNNTSTNHNTPDFSWGTSTDPESQPITYTLKLSTTAGFTEPVYRTVASLGTTSYTPAGGGDEIPEGSYFWKVIASDGVVQTESTQTWQLTVDTQMPAVPVITFVGSNSQTGKISEIRGTGENGTTLTLYDKNNNTISGTTDWAGGIFTFTPTTPLDSGSSVYVESRDGATNMSQSRTRVMSFESSVDIFRDTAVYHGAAPGTSIQMQKDTAYEFDIAVNDGVAPEPDNPVTVKAYVRYSSEYGSADKPRITLSGLGISGTQTGENAVAGVAALNAWEELTVSGTPNAKGVVTLKVETFSTAVGAKAWVDDISVSQ